LNSLMMLMINMLRVVLVLNWAPVCLRIRRFEA
jgi:hypothetical protein